VDLRGQVVDLRGQVVDLRGQGRGSEAKASAIKSVLEAKA